MAPLLCVIFLVPLAMSQVLAQCYTSTVSSQARTRRYGPIDVTSQSECEFACSCATGMPSACSSLSFSVPSRNCLAYSFDPTTLKCSLLGDTIIDTCTDPVTIFVLESCTTTNAEQTTTIAESATATTQTITTTIDPCTSVNCTHGRCTAIFGGSTGVCTCNANWQGAKCDQSTINRTLSTDPICYQLPASMNSSSIVTYDLENTVDKCKAIMMANETNEFFVISGFLCYVGMENILTQNVSVSNCNGACPGNWAEKCASNSYGLLYQYIYTQDPNACDITPPLCNAANEQGYCIDEQGGYSCVCAPDWSGDNCDTSAAF